MTMTRADLEGAAFWHKWVCLDCEEAAEEEDLENVEPVCPSCESDAVYPAALILRCADFIEGEG